MIDDLSEKLSQKAIDICFHGKGLFYDNSSSCHAIIIIFTGSLQNTNSTFIFPYLGQNPICQSARLPFQVDLPHF